MLDKSESHQGMKNFFRKNRVANMCELSSLLQTTSRMSVFRRLRELDYLSSYSHAGRYYTLRSVAKFDTAGIWSFNDIGFSKFGNLKETLVHMIDQSEAGKTHSELESQLDVRVHNTLLDLVCTKRIDREELNGKFLYLSADSKRSKRQVLQRSAFVDCSEPDWLTIEILAEVIRSHRIQIDPHAIAVQLNVRGVQITTLQVEEVLKQLEVKKTRDYR